MPKPLVLFLAANPKGTTQLALTDECAAIIHELKTTPGRTEIDFQTRWAVTIDDLMRELNDLNPMLVHFSGHGNAQGIALLGKHREAQLIAPEALAGLFKSRGGSTRVAVLNACYSDDQAEILSEQIGCAVGMRGAVDDDAALEFSVAFYRALGHGHSVYDAFLQAQAVLAAKRLTQLAVARCKTRPNVDAAKLVLYGAAAEPKAVLASPATPQPSPSPPSQSAGRDNNTATAKDIHAGNNNNISVSAGSK